MFTGVETEMNIKRRKMSENYFRQQPLDAPFYNLSVTEERELHFAMV
jgi:hypothetical protein